MGLPLLLWRMQNRRYRALQAFRLEVVRLLRQSNEELDWEWRRRRPATTAEAAAAAAGERSDNNSDKRWQWRWIGVQRNSNRNFRISGEAAIVTSAHRAAKSVMRRAAPRLLCAGCNWKLLYVHTKPGKAAVIHVNALLWLTPESTAMRTSAY